MVNLGLKLYSNQLERYKEETITLIEKNKFSYIELFVYPDSIEVLKDWKAFKSEFKLNFTLHAPHFSNGVNLADKDLEARNIEVYNQVKEFKKELDAKYIIVHGGIEGSIEEALRQIEKINPPDMRIENKPPVSPRKPDKHCRGAKIEEIMFIMERHGCKFCLDVGHAFCTAVELGINQFEYLNSFQNLNPDCYHLSDGNFDSHIDIHYHIGKGDYDWKKIFSIIDTKKNMTLETVKKTGEESLTYFENDVDEVNRLVC
jgi:sugar phosphate isomerase/epimerase